MFISCEGPDGCGKSTQARMLADSLTAAGEKVILTREPGGSPGAEEIRRLILQGSTDKWSPETEILLFNAARRDHLEKTVWPALRDGAIVITDRFVDSTFAYQGARSPALREMAQRIHDVSIGTMPDLTFIFDVRPEVAAQRMADRGLAQDRMEARGSAFQQAVREGLLATPGMRPGVVLIDAEDHPEEIARHVMSAYLKARQSPSPEM